MADQLSATPRNEWFGLPADLLLALNQRAQETPNLGGTNFLLELLKRVTPGLADSTLGSTGRTLDRLSYGERIANDPIHTSKGLLSDQPDTFNALMTVAPGVAAIPRVAKAAGTLLGPELASRAEGYLQSIGAMPGVVRNADRASEVARVNRRVGTTGQYVGAPPGVDSPQALGAMVNNYVRGMEEGMPGRNFYTDSSADIWARTGRDPVQSDLFAQNIAALSRANNVGGNTSMSAKAHLQAATGEPIKTGRFPSRDSPPLQQMYDAGQAEYLGHKRDPFATQLGVAYAPERIGRGVNDMHEAELMGYPSGAVAGPTQHAFMDEVRARAIAKANKEKLGGFSDWGTGNAQAAAWTGNKIRRGDLSPGDAAKSYADFLPLHEANSTYEAVSAPVTGHLSGLLDAPYLDRQAFTIDPRGSWATSPSGRDIGYTAARMLPGDTVEATGRFRNSANPAYVARPVVGTETLPDGSRAMTEGSKNSLNLVEGARAYFDAQEAGAWHKVMPAKSAADYSGATLNFGRPFVKSDMELVAPLFEKEGYYLGSSPHGITVIANDSTKKGADFANDVRRIMKENKSAFSGAKVDLGRVESGYIDFSSSAWGAGKGSGANQLLSLVDKAPKTAGLLEGSSNYRNTVVARNSRDIDAALAGKGVAREDVLRAREIFARDGWAGIRAAAKAGTIPAALVSMKLWGAAEDRTAD